EERNIAPLFDHYAALPVLEFSSSTAIVIAGELAGIRSPARTFSPIIGAEISLRDWQTITLPLNSSFEHAIFVLDGDVVLDGKQLEGETLHYLGIGRHELH